MGRGFVASLAAVVLLAGSAQAGQEQQRRKWWQDEKMKAEIGLTEQQSAEVEAVFQSALPRLRAFKEQLDTLEAELSRLIKERVADEHVVASQIDRVEAARADLSKTRTLMLYRMHRILTPEQNTKVQAMHERWQKERGTNNRRPRS